MAYRCDVCGKGRLIGKNVSHSAKRTRKISLPNLHRFRGVLNGKKGKWLLCTKCLRKVKAMSVTRQSLPAGTHPETV